MPTDTALLVIDVQVAIVDDPSTHRGPEVLVRIADLLDRARGAGTPVVFVQHEEPNYPAMMLGAPGWQIHPAVAPLPGEPIVAKTASDAFCGTTLRSLLDDRGVTRLVVAGCQTDYCVDTTTRRALSLDYDVTLAADAHTTSDNSVLTAAQIIAHHNAALAGLSHPTRTVAVVPAGEIAF